MPKSDNTLYNLTIGREKERMRRWKWKLKGRENREIAHLRSLKRIESGSFSEE
jgi:hypothetical protein